MSTAQATRSIDVNKPAILNLSGKKFYCRKGKWKEEEASKADQSKLEEKVNQLIDENAYLELKLEIATEMLTLRTLETKELKKEVERLQKANKAKLSKSQARPESSHQTKGKDTTATKTRKRTHDD
ncbi:hypothetical protein BLNAU_10846 [Blattamonas nauphoetae]|uniref:Uncharacterized protein n=1 Tax=Blattamonas nauphoetae TaxID=2049346 RepID=A0ABQ9XSV9_9EUKA|nr:hypothetical protein BLNAU_10846 [Blattamonas nauphoetae]